MDLLDGPLYGTKKHEGRVICNVNISAIKLHNSHKSNCTSNTQEQTGWRQCIRDITNYVEWGVIIREQHKGVHSENQQPDHNDETNKNVEQ